MSQTCTDRPSRKRCQAVVVIHGIGEQRPMDTLRGFVDSVLDVDARAEQDPSAPPAYYSKPDSLSDSFELRSLVTRVSRPRTEFFEFYWAHRMPTATWARIFEWGQLLLRRSIGDVPRQFRGLWWGLWLTLVVVGLLLAVSIWLYAFPAAVPREWVRGQFAMPIGASILLLAIQAVVLSTIGDAAIYLSPFPRNIEARHAIRGAGVALIERLHDSGKYDRIIVVGHSLGSVIGYDVLSFAWQRYNDKHGNPARPRRDQLKSAEAIAKQMEAPGAAGIAPLKAQWAEAARALWCEQREMGSPWLVTDFVTLGSPLAHGDLLLARGRADFARKISQRELPVCPPVPEPDGGFSFPSHYSLSDGSNRTTFVMHHAAWLASVRWSNLFFPSRALFHGDPIGGPVAPLFGAGVRDIPVQTKFLGGWLAHTSYWRRDPRDAGHDQAPVEQLYDALDLWRKTFPKSCTFF